METSLNSGETYFHDLCQSLGFVCIGVDPGLQVRFWNRQAAQQFGKHIADMRGRSVLELIEESDRSGVETSLRRALDQGEPGEQEVRYGEGIDRKTFVMIISPIVSAGGAREGASISMRDISQRKRLSQELARSRRMASLGTMAEGIVDHFNNILGGMLTSIECVLASDSVRELRSTLRVLAESIDRAGRIIRRLANFAESQQEHMEWVDLNSLLRQFEEHLRRMSRSQAVKLDISIEHVEPVMFEKQRVLPVLESVAQNALDAMPEGGTLTVRIRPEAKEVVARLSDTGCGMTDEQMDHLYEPFYTTKGVRGGGPTQNIGLGLAAVHGMVSELGGSIDIESQLGQGTTVTIRFPVDRRPAGEERGVVPSTQGGGPAEARPPSA